MDYQSTHDLTLPASASNLPVSPLAIPGTTWRADVVQQGSDLEVRLHQPDSTRYGTLTYQGCGPKWQLSTINFNGMICSPRLNELSKMLRDLLTTVHELLHSLFTSRQPAA